MKAMIDTYSGPTDRLIFAIFSFCHFHIWLSFLHDRALVGICRWHGGLCLLTAVSGSIPGPI